MQRLPQRDVVRIRVRLMECARADMLAVGCEEVSLGTGTCRVVLDLMMSSRRNAGRLLEESAAAEI